MRVSRRLFLSLEVMPWLTAARARILIGVGLGGALTVLALHWRHGFDIEKMPNGRDFACFWAAAQLALAGQAAAAYSSDPLALAEQAIYRPDAYEGFFYPPVFLMLCLPFAGLPYFVALAAFLGTTAAAYFAALLRAGRSAWVAAAAFAFPAAISNLLAGQNGMLTAAILGGGLTLLDRRPRLAGLILGCMVIKPHLALAVPLALLLTRRWTVLGHAALSGLALLAVSTLLFGWEIWPAFEQGSAAARLWLEQGAANPNNRFLSIFALIRRQGGMVELAYAAQLLSAVGVAVLLERALRRRLSPALEKALIVLATLLMTPFLWPYDLSVLAFPLAWLIVEWSAWEFPRGGKLVLLLGFVLPLPALLTPGQMGLTLLGLVGLAGYVFRIATRPAGQSALNPLTADNMLTAPRGS